MSRETVFSPRPDPPRVGKRCVRPGAIVLLMSRETVVDGRPPPLEALGGYLTWLGRTGRKDSTKAVYADRVRRFVEWLEQHQDRYASALHDDDVRDYAARDYRRMLIENRLAPATVALHMAAIGDLFRWAHMDPPNLPKTVLDEGEGKALTREQVRDVLRAATRRGVRDAALIHLLFYTAVRVGEVCSANAQDLIITPRDGRLDVIGKGDKQRSVIVSTECRAALAPWLRQRATLPHASPTGPLFYTREGRRLTVSAAEHAVERVGFAAGIVDVDEEGRRASRSWLHPHVFRHTWTTLYLQGDPARSIAPGDIRTAQRVLGHANIQTTAGYATPSLQRRREAMESMHIET